MIRLGARLTRDGGRESVVRLVVTAFGIGLGVALLLFASVAFHALHGHDQRKAWMGTSSKNRRPAQDEAMTDPLLWRLTADRFEGHDLVRLDVAAEGPRAPLPPGIARLPGAGQVLVSPALQQMLVRTPPAMLADRFPGHVTGIVGRALLVSPDDLVAVMGHASEELRGAPRVEEVRSIESFPPSQGFSDFLRIVLVIGGMGLLVPVLVFLSTSTRLAAARREQRLAALRLAGATPGQTARVAAVEAAFAAVAGVLLGFATFLATRPIAARIPFDGSSFFISDFALSPAAAIAVALGVPTLGALAAVVSLRRVRISPLGATRRSRPSRATVRRLLPLAFGLVGLPLSIAMGGRGGGARWGLWGIGLCFVLVVLGVALAGPWLTLLVARILDLGGGRAPVLLAARRLADNPSAGFRAISGLVLAVFVASVFNGLTPSVLAGAGRSSPGALQATSVGAVVSTTLPNGLPPGEARALLAGLRAVPGVTAVGALRQPPASVGSALPPDAAPRSKAGDRVAVAPGLIACSDLAVIGKVGNCADRGAVTEVDVGRAIQGRADLSPHTAVPVEAAQLNSLPLVAVVAATDGRSSSIERARTLIEQTVPGVPALTGADIARGMRRQLIQLQRLTNVGLLLTLLVAGCSLAVAVASGLVERKRPLALLRLAGMRLEELRTMVLVEAAAPLLLVALVSAGLGLFVAWMFLALVLAPAFQPPSLLYWATLFGGLAGALAIVAATLPLLSRVTSLESARFE